MKIRSGILFVAGLLSTCLAFAQTDVDYQPKALTKALEKSGIAELSEIQEIVLSETNYPNELQGKYFRIIKDNDAQYRYIYIGRVNSCRAGGCSSPGELHVAGDSEYFDYYILFNAERNVMEVKVFNYQATHGQEITAKGWLKQFIGYDGSDSLKVDKDIDAISGATISVYAITADVQNKTTLLQKLKL